MDEATLRDVTAAPNPTPAAAPEPAKAEPAPAAAPVNTDALEVGQLLLDSGYTKDQINDLLQTPQALQSMRYLINNDPAEFVKLLERNDPQAGENFLEKTSQLYLDRYYKGDAKPGTSKESKEVPPELMSEVTKLREELHGLRTREDQRNAAATMASTQARYNARVDEMFGLDGVKNLGLTKSEEKAMRARLNQELAGDPLAVQRVSNGNFVDVPRRFQGIVDEWASDKKAATEAATKARERVSNTASPMVLDGPNPFSVDIPSNAFDSWESTEEAYAKALERAR